MNNIYEIAILFMYLSKSLMENMRHQEKISKSDKLKAAIYEWISIVLWLGLSLWAFSRDDIKIFKTWFFIPVIPFIFCIFYRVKEIVSNLKEIGLVIASIFAYLESIGINGLPAIAIILFLVLFISEYFSEEKTLSELVKVFGGIAGGSFAQAKINSYQNKKNNDKEK